MFIQNNTEILFLNNYADNIWVVLGPWLNAIFRETNRSRVIIHSYCSFDYCKHGEMNIKWMHNVPSIVLVFSVVAARKGLALHLEVHSVFHVSTHTTHCSYLNHSCYRINNPQIASVYLLTLQTNKYSGDRYSLFTQHEW